MSKYEVKWKGRHSGPYSLDELREKFDTREIGGMHEVSVDGQWMTVRAFFRRNSSQSPVSPEDNPGTGTGHSGPAPVGSISQPAIRTHPPTMDATPAIGGPEMAMPNHRDWLTDSIQHFYAGFWIRAMALFLDGLFLVWAPLWAFDYYQEASTLTLDTLRSLTVVQWSIAGFAVSAAGWLYFTVFEVSPLNGSLGKRIVGLEVSRNNGSKIDIRTASLRNLAKIGSGLMLGIGFFISLFSPRGQTFHDLVSHTVVSQKLSETNVFSIRH
ncbi:RDD family protein [Verrucomicrobiales bacterium]|nr:RDD family protein [Verrucomicrobiales bacterium]